VPSDDLLVGDRRQDHVAGQIQRSGVRDRKHRRGQCPLHVVGPTAVETTVLDASVERRLHCLDSDRVEMRVQQQGSAAAGSARYADH